MNSLRTCLYASLISLAAPAFAEEVKAPPAAAPVAPPEDLGKWRYFKTIKLDTTASGTKVKGDVKNFPVAVLLDAANFDFGQAGKDGADLRFSRTAKGDALPYSIESWDAAGRTAVVWVKLDVKGNNKAQSFVMHWGNADAKDAGDSRAVFNTKEGWVGVYHLNDAGSSTEEGYKDATGNQAHMTGVNLDAGARADGRLGKGVVLDYAKVQWLKLDHRVLNVPKDDSWLKLDYESQKEGSKLLSFGKTQERPSS